MGAFSPALPPQTPVSSVVPSGSGQCLEVPKDYPFTYTIATADSTVTNLAQLIDTDADFYLRGIMFMAGTQANGTGGINDYSVQFEDSALFKLQSALCPWQLLATADPLGMYVVEPQLYFPKGSRIFISLQDTSGVNNNQVQILFRGIAKYYV